MVLILSCSVVLSLIKSALVKYHAVLYRNENVHELSEGGEEEKFKRGQKSINRNQ